MKWGDLDLELKIEDYKSYVAEHIYEWGDGEHSRKPMTWEQYYAEHYDEPIMGY